ncbi:MAG: ABC transporter permease, partial [bacterium]|nr:ABC transporter permease [bacterium]
MKMLLFLLRRFWWRFTLPLSVRRMQRIVVAGIAIGVAALLMSLSVTQGFERDYKKALLSFNAHLMVLPVEERGVSKEEIAKGIDAESITPYLYREALLIHKGRIKGVVLKGQNLPAGQAGTEDRRPKDEIVLGGALAQTLGVQKGETVRLLLPNGRDISAKNVKEIKVGETFQSGLYEFDSQFALLDIETLQNFFSLPKDFQGYEIRISDPEQAPLVAEKLEEMLGPLVTVENWIDINRPLFEALRMERWLFWILMGLMVFAAALNLIGAVLLSIFRRLKTTSILRALGVPPWKTRLLFTLQGFLLGLLGVV